MADNIVQIIYNEVHHIVAANTTAIINSERLSAIWQTVLFRSYIIKFKT